MIQLTEKQQAKVDEAYRQFKSEAELFFVTKYLTGNAIDKEYKFCLDVLLGLTKTTDQSRGLIAFNTRYGQGKTFFFDVVHHRVKRKLNFNLYKKTSARELCNIYMNAGNKEKPTAELDKFIKVKNLYIQDIGDELHDGRERTVYGNKLNVLRYVLLRRYELWIEKGYKLFGDTNLTIENVAANYGGRVADRLQQMVYWRTFQFLPDKESFRQRTDTRKLTQEEIRANVLKLQKKEPVEKIDLDKYFNEMILEPEEKLHAMGSYFWTFCKDYLIKKGLLKDNDLKYTITEELLTSSRSLILLEKKNALKSQISDILAYTKRAEEVEKNITDEDVRKHAEGIKAKQLFLTLKQKEYKF